MATTAELKIRAAELRRTARSDEIVSSEPHLVSICLEREAAGLAWAASVREHFEAKGQSFFDYKHSWLPDREKAIEAYRKANERRRREDGDREIVRRIEEIEGRESEGSYKITKARGKVLKAVVGIASGSGRLFCSYHTLAKTAGVSSRTAHTVRAELEDLGVLERVRTGGKAVDGTCHSNKYTVKWNMLRKVLGIRNRWASRYPADTKNIVAVYPTAPRKRFFTWMTTRVRSKGLSQAVENSLACKAFDHKRAENTFFEQGFCTLTELITQNKSLITQPGLSSFSIQGFSKATPVGKDSEYSLLQLVGKSLTRRLAKLSESKLALVYTELQSHLAWTPAYASLDTMIEDYLSPILSFEGV